MVMLNIKPCALVHEGDIDNTGLVPFDQIVFFTLKISVLIAMDDQL